MHRAAGLTLLAVVACVSACSDSEPVLLTSVASNERLARFDFSINGVGYAISLPEQAGMHPQPDPRSMTFAARKGQRLQKTMVLAGAPQSPDQNFDRQHLTRDDRGRILRDAGSRVVRYRALGKTGEGSGGSIEEIAGRIDIGTRVLYFRCTDQGELSIRRDWCLDYINSLQITPQPSSGSD